MRIIHISSHFPPSMGGIQNVIKELSGRLAKKFHQVEVFTSDIGCPKDKQLKSKKNLKIHYLPAKEFAHTPIMPSLYNKLMKIPQDSIMHVHVAQAYVPEVVYRVWKKRNIPYIAHVHGDVEPSSFIGKLILNRYKKIFIKRFLRNASRVVILNKDYQQIVLDKYNIKKDKITIIPNGINNSFFIRKKKNNKIFHLLFVGRITVEKNLFNLVKSISLLKSKTLLDIVGDGDLLEKTKKLVKEKRLTNIVFHGKKSGRELIEMYQNANLLILPSKKESFGIVLLEAMASRTAIIASNIPGIRSVVKHNYNGLLVDPTPEKIAEAIEKLSRCKKLRETLAKNGLSEVKKYSWDKIVKQTEDAYREVLKEHKEKQNETTKNKKNK